MAKFLMIGQEVLLEQYNAKEYIKHHFTDLSDDQYDIYINIFNAGFKETNKINSNGG